MAASDNGLTQSLNFIYNYITSINQTRKSRIGKNMGKIW